MSIVHLTSIVLCLLLPGCTRTGGEKADQLPRAASATTGGSGTLQDADTNRLRLTVQLRDGSRLAGIPRVKDIPLQTAYGTMAVPLSNIRSVQLADDGLTATVEFRNGDVLHGKIQVETFPLETLLGKLDVPVQTVAKISRGTAEAESIEGLVAYYPLDGSTADASGNGHDGVNHGAVPAVDRYGHPDKAFEFNGADSYIGLPNGLMDPAGTGFTWSLWTVCREKTGERYLLYGGANTAESGVEWRDGRFSFSVRLENNEGYAVSVAAPPESYIHLACVYRRGAYVQIWVNGRLGSQVPVPDGILMHGSNQHSAAIGSYAPEQPNHMHYYHIRTWLGLIDEVRIYRRPLDRSEIELLASDH